VSQSLILVAPAFYFFLRTFLNAKAGLVLSRSADLLNKVGW